MELKEQKLSETSIEAINDGVVLKKIEKYLDELIIAGVQEGADLRNKTYEDVVSLGREYGNALLKSERPAGVPPKSAATTLSAKLRYQQMQIQGSGVIHNEHHGGISNGEQIADLYNYCGIIDEECMQVLLDSAKKINISSNNASAEQNLEVGQLDIANEYKKELENWQELSESYHRTLRGLDKLRDEGILQDDSSIITKLEDELKSMYKLIEESQSHMNSLFDQLSHESKEKYLKPENSKTE